MTFKKSLGYIMVRDYCIIAILTSLWKKRGTGYDFTKAVKLRLHLKPKQTKYKFLHSNVDSRLQDQM